MWGWLPEGAIKALVNLVGVTMDMGGGECDREKINQFLDKVVITQMEIVECGCKFDIFLSLLLYSDFSAFGPVHFSVSI